MDTRLDYIYLKHVSKSHTLKHVYYIAFIEWILFQVQLQIYDYFISFVLRF